MMNAMPSDLNANPLNAVFDFLHAQASAALCAMANHLLALEPELQAMLAHHAQGTLELRWPPKAFLPAGTVCLRITGAQTFEVCQLNAPADVVVTIKEGFIGAAQDQKLRFLRVEGDAMLAQTLALLAQRLRWDAEHDLARWVGDGPAGFLAKHARAFATDVLAAAKTMSGVVQNAMPSEVRAFAQNSMNQAATMDFAGVKICAEALAAQLKATIEERFNAAHFNPEMKEKP